MAYAEWLENWRRSDRAGGLEEQWHLDLGSWDGPDRMSENPHVMVKLGRVGRRLSQGLFGLWAALEGMG